MRNFCIIFISYFVSQSFASSKFSNYLNNKVNYKTYFGSCPTKVAGDLTLILTKEFEKRSSLKDVKEKIIKDELFEKYFLSEYKLSYNPQSKLLKLRFDCPIPLMKVQIYKENGDEFYTSILVENGKLFDPTYEVMLRSSGKLKEQLPNLAMPVTLINKDQHFKITELLKTLTKDISYKLSEVILNSEGELTMILSINNRPSSVFIGKDFWDEKILKLVKVVDFMKKKKTIPAVINLTNAKKIVVKFPHSI